MGQLSRDQVLKRETSQHMSRLGGGNLFHDMDLLCIFQDVKIQILR